MISTLFGIIGLLFSNIISINEIWDTFQTWWFGDIVGIVLITPFILSWFTEDPSKRNKINLSELFLFGIITIILSYSVFFKFYDQKYLLLPLLFWSVYRFGTKTSSLVIIISSFAIITTSIGIGPFIKDSIIDSVLYLDLFLCVISICSLFFQLF